MRAQSVAPRCGRVAWQAAMRRLELVRPRPPAGAGAGDALVDHGAVPAGAVLVLQRHQPPRRRCGACTPGVVEQHEGEQAADLGLGGHQAASRPAEADRFLGDGRAPAAE